MQFDYTGFISSWYKLERGINPTWLGYYDWLLTSSVQVVLEVIGAPKNW